MGTRGEQKESVNPFGEQTFVVITGSKRFDVRYRCSPLGCHPELWADTTKRRNVPTGHDRIGPGTASDRQHVSEHLMERTGAVPSDWQFPGCPPEPCSPLSFDRANHFA